MTDRSRLRAAVCLASVLFPLRALAQFDSLLPPPPEILTTTWFYWVLPLFATIVALTIGLQIHKRRVRATIRSWPRADTSFSALCRRAIFAVVFVFVAVMAIFAWVAFSPRTGDEWILHRTVAMSSVAAGLILCSIPWLLTLRDWRQ